MKKIKYRNNNTYNNQIYSINYKFDSISPAGKCTGTALDLIKRYNELAKEAQGNGNHVEAEVFRQYAEHYRKIVTDINERKAPRFTPKEASAPAPEQGEQAPATLQTEPQTGSSEVVASTPSAVVQEEAGFVETKTKPAQKSFTVIEVSAPEQKRKRGPRKKLPESTTETASA